jgi:hypothetical protein
MAANDSDTTAIKQRKEQKTMLRHRMSPIVVTALVVAAAVTRPNFSIHTAGDSSKREVPKFSYEERARIMRISNAPVTEVLAPEVADSLPEEVPMQDLPNEILRDIPLAHGHKFVKFDDRILVVSPADR